MFSMLMGLSQLRAQNWSTSLNGTTPLFFGTAAGNNYPLRFYTFGNERMYLNQDLTNNINSQGNMARNGYLGLGRNFTPSFSWNNTTGPYSLLHLNGDDGTFMQQFGYRNWMKNGITFTANDDIMFVGPKRVGANDVTNAVFAWGDNGLGGSSGPDNMIFTFIGGTGTGTDLDGGGPDGREIMRLSGPGNVGIGPRFYNNNQPQSDLHINRENSVGSWLQLSYQNLFSASTPPGSGTYTSTRGLRMGMSSGIGYLYNQENAHLIFSTNAATNTSTGLARERMRITHIGASGIPATAAANSTRVAISLNPANPLTAPRSLVHIGEPLSQLFTDGIRDWMNVGYLSTFESDNMYVGLKQEGTDRQDAVISWGDNQTNLNDQGPDNLRFIFTSTQNPLVNGTEAAKSPNGEEVARFTPACANCPVNKPSMGIGDFSPGGVNPEGTATYVGATLDIDGDLRIRNVKENNELRQVLMRDPKDLGRVYWRDISSIGGGGGGGNLGNYCNAADNPLLEDYKIPMADYNFVFAGQSAQGAARVGIGLSNCSPVAKLHVLRDGSATPATGDFTPTGIFSHNRDISASGSYMGLAQGLVSETEGTNKVNVSGAFRSKNAVENIGVEGYANGTGPAGGQPVINEGGIFTAVDGTDFNIGVYGTARTLNFNGTHSNTGGNFVASGLEGGTNFGVNVLGTGGANSTIYGGHFSAQGPVAGTATAYGVYASVFPYLGPPPTSSWAGYFNGNVHATGVYTSSDRRIKDIQRKITGATDILNRVNVYEYTYNDYAKTFMTTEDGTHYGVVAQELAEVLPSLVNDAKYISYENADGGMKKASENEIKTVNYTELIPVLIAGFQEQSARIAELEAKLAACCEAPAAAPADNSTHGAVIRTSLQSTDEPLLGQNIPNPFQSETRIPVYIPSRVAKAEIVFYGNDGKILQNVAIADRGNVTVEVNSEALVAGVYSYTLFVDGKPHSTLRMIKQQ